MVDPPEPQHGVDASGSPARPPTMGRVTREVLEPSPVVATTEPVGPTAPAPAAARHQSTVERLRTPMPTDQLGGWLVALTITAIAFVTRLVDLGRPNRLVFDETYYAKDGWSLLRFGYERTWPDTANASITAGNPDVMQPGASFVAHPMLGKWLIGAGEAIFGMNSFGWRFASLVCGALMVLVLIRLVRRVSRSTLVGGLAGLLLTFDGLAFVMGRTALLDGFLAFFLVAAVACLVADRDWFRNRLADHLLRHDLPDLGGRFGPALVLRPWRLAAGLCFGLALGTKWNALYVLAAFALLSLAWDIGARRLAGAGVRANAGLLRDGVPAFVSLVVLSAVVYVASWASWLATSGGHYRDWGAKHPDALSVRLLGEPLASLLRYHREIWAFHTGDYINNATHSYDAHPAGWLLIGRPLLVHSEFDIAAGVQGCTGPEACARVILAIGTPALWWAGIIALVIAVLLWVGNRDWRFSVPVVGVLSGWLPWFLYADRPVFYMYAVVIVPFTAMALALVLGKLLGGARSGDRRMIGAVVVGAFVALVGANFAYLYPILSGDLLPYSSWRSRMWFKTWV